jgi:hypothetical protein
MRTFAYAGGLTSAHRLEGLGKLVFYDMRDLPAYWTIPTGAHHLARLVPLDESS